jgi:hypothetical protein
VLRIKHIAYKALADKQFIAVATDLEAVQAATLDKVFESKSVEAAGRRWEIVDADYSTDGLLFATLGKKEARIWNATVPKAWTIQRSIEFTAKAHQLAWHPTLRQLLMARDDGVFSWDADACLLLCCDFDRTASSCAWWLTETHDPLPGFRTVACSSAAMHMETSVHTQVFVVTSHTDRRRTENYTQNTFLEKV